MAASADAEQQRAAGEVRAAAGEEEINKVLAEARRLASELDPLYEWDDLCEIIQNWCVPTPLRDLSRHART
jgi:hypothetical protein